jgi:hypothetical protein
MSVTTYDACIGLLHTPEPPGLGLGPRAKVKAADTLREAMDDLARRLGLPARSAVLTLALVLLWHDHLEAAHQLVQEIHDADGSYLHAIMHRREPDYSNSKYWWRQVGDHPAFAPLVVEVQSILEQAKRPELLERLAPGNKWDPFAFVDFCRRAAESAGGEDGAVAIAIQQAEFLTLLAHLCSTNAG